MESGRWTIENGAMKFIPWSPLLPSTSPPAIPSMLTRNELTDALRAALTTAGSGVHDAVVLDKKGEVLAFGGGTSKEDISVRQSMSAMASNMWLLLQKSGEIVLCEDFPVHTFISCERGKILISRMAPDFALCLNAESHIGFGFLKNISTSLKQFLEPPLNELSVSLSFIQ